MYLKSSLQLTFPAVWEALHKFRTLNEKSSSKSIILEFLLTQLHVNTQLLKSWAAICVGAVSTHNHKCCKFIKAVPLPADIKCTMKLSFATCSTLLMEEINISSIKLNKNIVAQDQIVSLNLHLF